MLHANTNDISGKGAVTLKRNPDDRSDNVERIQEHIDDTLRNIREADKTIRATSNDKTRAELSAKNERRAQALDSMRHEIKDEADHRKSMENRHSDRKKMQ
jgi:small acid-soluble spore protein (thioredoxin-like protein)